MSAINREVLSILVRTYSTGRQVIVQCQPLATKVGCHPDSIKRALRQLEQAGFLSKRKVRYGSVQGLEVVLFDGPCQRFHALSDTPTEEPAGTLTNTSTDALTDALSKPVRTPDRASDRVGDEVKEEAASPFLEERKKDLSICAKLKAIEEADFAAFWPDLAATGFGTHQVRQIAEKRQAMDKTLDFIQQGFDHADAAIRLGCLKGAKGSEVKDPCAYVYAALLRDGSFPRPAGWISPEEQARQEAEARLQALQEARRLQEEAVREQERQAQEAAFQAWCDGLTDDERQAALAGRMGPEDVWLRQVWRQRTTQPASTSAATPPAQS